VSGEPVRSSGRLPIPKRAKKQVAALKRIEGTSSPPQPPSEAGPAFGTHAAAYKGKVEHRRAKDRMR